MWIQSHQEIGRHPKTKRAARALDVSIPAIVGHLHLLWHWCLDFAQDGDLTDYPVEDIADAAMWEGDAITFSNALLESGFVTVADNRRYVNDWEEYGGKVIEQRRSHAERQKAYRGRQKPAKGRGAESDDDNADSDITVTDEGVPVTGSARATLEESREEEIREDNNTLSPAHTRGDLKELEVAVWQVVGKDRDWQMGTVSSGDRRDVGKMMSKLQRDGRTVADVRTYAQKFPAYLGRAPSEITPPSPSQMLANFDTVFNFRPREAKDNERKQQLPARVANDNAAAERFLAKRGVAVGGGGNAIPNARRSLPAATDRQLPASDGGVVGDTPEQSGDPVARSPAIIRQRDPVPRQR